MAFLNLLFDCVEAHWVRDHGIIIGSLLLTHRLTEWPGVFVIVERLQNVFALFVESLLFRAFGFIIVPHRPTRFYKARNFCKLDIFSLRRKGIINIFCHNLVNFLDDKVSLSLDGTGNILIVGALVDFALHHGRAAVVFDIALPPRLRHLHVLREALLSEIFDGIVISVRHKILDANCLSMGLQSVHEASSVAFYLMLGGDGQKNDLGKSLGVERSEDAPANNRNFRSYR